MTRDLPPAGPVLASRVCEHCRGDVVDAVRTGTEITMLVDAAPSQTGRLLVDVAADGTVLAGVASPGAARSARVIGRLTYSDHADTCPFAHAWNKPARRGRPPARAATRRR